MDDLLNGVRQKLSDWTGQVVDTAKNTLFNPQGSLTPIGNTVNDLTGFGQRQITQPISNAIKSYYNIVYPQLTGQSAGMQDVGNIVGGVGAVTNIPKNVGTGLIGGGVQSVYNIATRKPVLQNVPQSFEKGYEFGRYINPLGEVVNPAVAPIAKAIAPSTDVIGNIARGVVGETGVGAAYGAVTGQNPITTAAQFAPFGLMKGLAPQANALQEGPLQGDDIKVIGEVANRASQNWMENGKVNLDQFQKDINLAETIWKDKYGYLNKDLKLEYGKDPVKMINDLLNVATEDYKQNSNITMGLVDKQPQGAKGTMLNEYTKAKDNLPFMEQTANNAAQEVGGRTIFNLKNPESAVNKVQAKVEEGRTYGLTDVNDYARGRVVVQNQDQVYQVAQNLEKQFKDQGLPVKVDDYFKNPQDGYKGYHIDVTFPNGQVNEIQIHTENSLAGSLLTHAAHEQYPEGEVPAGVEAQKENLYDKADQMSPQQARVLNDQMESKALSQGKMMPSDKADFTPPVEGGVGKIKVGDVLQHTKGGSAEIISNPQPNLYRVKIIMRNGKVSEEWLNGDEISKYFRTTPPPVEGGVSQLESAKNILKNNTFNDFEIKGYMGQDAKYNPQGISSEVWKQASKEVGFKPENLQQFKDGTFGLKSPPVEGGVTQLDLIKRYVNETGQKINTEADLQKVAKKYPQEWGQTVAEKNLRNKLWNQIPQQYRQNAGLNEYSTDQLKKIVTSLPPVEGGVGGLTPEQQVAKEKLPGIMFSTEKARAEGKPPEYDPQQSNKFEQWMNEEQKLRAKQPVEPPSAPQKVFRYEPQATKNKVDLPIKGDTDTERVKSAIVNSERVKNEISVRGKDAYIAGTKLSASDMKLAEKYQEGISIDDLAKQAQNPVAFKDFMKKITDYYDFRLATDRAVGGQTPLRENYLRQRWDLSNKEDLDRFNALAQQRGVRKWAGFSSQPRVFDTYAEGEAAGFKRLNPTILGDLKDDYNQAGFALSRQALRYGLMMGVPDKVNAKGTGFTPEGKPFINSNVPGLEGLSYHPDIADQLKGFTPLKGKDLFREIKDKGFVEGLKSTGVLNSIASLYDHSSSGMKQFILNFSGFHSINVSGNYAGAEIFHPVNAVKGLTRSAFSFFSEGETQKIIEGFRNKAVTGKNYSVFDAGLRSGVNLDRQLPAIGLGRINIFSSLNRAIFDRELYTLKLHLTDQVFGDGRIDPESPQGHVAGAEINKIIGEVNNKTMNIDPNTQKWLSRIFLAPGFTESKYMTLVDTLKGGTEGNMARTAVIGKSIIFGTLATLGTQLATGKFPTLAQVLTNYTVNPSIQTNLTNPKGKKQDIVLPTTFLSEPSRPIMGLLKGSTDELTHYGQARLNPVLSGAQALYTNKDYYGNPIVNTESKTPVPIQLAKNIGISKLPIGVQNLVNLGQGKITPEQALIQIIGLRTKTNENDPTIQYFKNLKATTDSINDPNLKNDFIGLHPITKDPDGNPMAKNNIVPSKYGDLVRNPKLLALETKFQQSLPNHDPLWDQTPQNMALIMASRDVLPGQTNQFKKILTTQPWYPQFLQEENKFFSSLPPSTAPSAADINKPLPSSYVQKQLDAKNYNDPEVQAYFRANDIYNNQLLARMNLPPVAGTGIGSTGSSSLSRSAGRMFNASFRNMKYNIRQAGNQARYNIKKASKTPKVTFGKIRPTSTVAKLKNFKAQVTKIKGPKNIAKLIAKKPKLKTLKKLS